MKLKKYKGLNEAFPPQKVYWGLYVVVAKMPKLRKILKKAKPNAKIRFELDKNSKSYGIKGSMEYDYKGKIYIYGMSDPNNLYTLYVDTSNNIVQPISDAHLYNVSDLFSELSDEPNLVV